MNLNIVINNKLIDNKYCEVTAFNREIKIRFLSECIEKNNFMYLEIIKLSIIYIKKYFDTKQELSQYLNKEYNITSNNIKSYNKEEYICLDCNMNDSNLNNIEKMVNSKYQSIQNKNKSYFF